MCRNTSTCIQLLVFRDCLLVFVILFGNYLAFFLCFIILTLSFGFSEDVEKSCKAWFIFHGSY